MTYYTTQAAKYLDTPSRTLRHWVERGWVQAKKVGLTYEFELNELERIKPLIYNKGASGRVFLRRPPPDGLVNLSQAALLMKCSRAWTSQLVQAGKLQVVKETPTARYIKLSQVMAFKDTLQTLRKV